MSFDEAMGVFLDPLQRSRLDEDHGAAEERWVTLGAGGGGKLFIVVHTYDDGGDDAAMVRIISARSPTKRETRQYEQGPPMNDEYDFTGATRGKFYRADAQPIPPVHLEPEVLADLSSRAKARGVSLSTLVNTLLKKDIELIRAAT